MEEPNLDDKSLAVDVGIINRSSVTSTRTGQRPHHSSVSKSVTSCCKLQVHVAQVLEACVTESVSGLPWYWDQCPGTL